MRKQDFLFNCALFLTILLWVYTVGSKLTDFHQFRLQLVKQPFSNQFAHFLLYFLPSIEVIALSLLSVSKFRFLGFCLSFLLLLAFTIYIALVVSKFYGHVPCSCGGILNKMGWQSHLWFNLVFLGINGYGVFHSARNVRKPRQ